MNYLDRYTDTELLELLNSNVEQELRNRGYDFGWYKVTKYAGEIYILVNPAFPNLVKIGYADNVIKRVKTLNSNSGLPDPYHIFATYKVKKRLEDLKLHNLIDSLDSDLRHSKNREFYEMTPEKAYEILSAIAQINGDEELLILNPLEDDFFDIQDTSIEVKERGRVKANLTFNLIGIKIGEKINFVEDDDIFATVNGEDTVEFEGKTWKLSALTRELKERNHTANNSGAYQGGNYFTYNGKKLTDIRREIEEGQVSADV